MSAPLTFKCCGIERPAQVHRGHMREAHAVAWAPPSWVQPVCIKCHRRAPVAGTALCGSCQVMVTGVLPLFPPLGLLLERHGTPADLAFLRRVGYPN